MRLIFSKDRPAQLDLLQRSIDRHCEPETERLLWYASTVGYFMGYQEIVRAAMLPTPPDRFDEALRYALSKADETVTFFCDDDVLYRPARGFREFLRNPEVLAFSLRLGRGNQSGTAPPVVTGITDDRVTPFWDWTQLPPTDFGFPGSIDGHCFRTSDVLAMIGDDVIPNPTMLETLLAHRADVPGRRLMGCFPEQCLVGVPVNRVSDQSGVPFGREHPQSAADLNDRFLAGKRIDLDALDFTGVDACHRELEYRWRPV